MFERYTEKARRVIFFARYEASQFGSPYIETEHLLLGLLREDKALTESVQWGDANKIRDGVLARGLLNVSAICKRNCPSRHTGPAHEEPEPGPPSGRP